MLSMTLQLHGESLAFQAGPICETQSMKALPLILIMKWLRFQNLVQKKVSIGYQLWFLRFWRHDWQWYLCSKHLVNILVGYIKQFVIM